MKRRNIVVTLLILVPFLCWGADQSFAQSPKKGGTINVGLNTDVTAVDPEGRGGHPIFPLSREKAK